MVLLVVPVLLLLLFCSGRSAGLTYHFGNGSYYEGEVDAFGMPSGNGSFFSRQGMLTYSGSFVAGQFHGNGEWFSPSGHHYTGDFENGAGSGEGTWMTPSGDFIHGQFRNHTVNGPAVWIFPSSSRLVEKMEGNFSRGMAHGPGTLYYRNGYRLEGFFKKGHPHGPAVLYRGDGRILWDGLFWNGAAATASEGRAALPTELVALFEIFHLNPLTLNYSDEDEGADEAQKAS